MTATKTNIPIGATRPGTRTRTTKGGAVHPAVQRSLAELGGEIALARRLRRISSQDMAERMGVDRSTLRRVERGDPGVSLNTLAMALAALGLLDRLGKLVDRAEDDIGLVAGGTNVPKRIFRPRRGRASPETPSETPFVGSSEESSESSSGASSAPDAPEGW